MKTILTIEGTPSELTRVLAVLGSDINFTSSPTLKPSDGNGLIDNDDEDTIGDNSDIAPGTLDGDGLPWDERIHSNPAKLTTKGVWRRKRGVTDAEVKAIEAELHANAPQTPVAPEMPTMPQAPVLATEATPAPTMPTMPQTAPAMPVNTMSQAPETAAPVMPVQSQTPIPLQTGAQSSGLDFNGFMQQVQKLLGMQFSNGTPIIDATYLQTLCQRLAQNFNSPINAITDIVGNQPMIDKAIEIMKQDQRWY